MDKKTYFDTKQIKGNYQKAVARETAKALISFCEQEQEFEQAIEQSGKTFQQCLDSACKGIGKSISDLEMFSKAVKFYFSIAKVHFEMRIDLSGDNGYEAPPITKTDSKPIEDKPKEKSGLTVSLDDLLDF